MFAPPEHRTPARVRFPARLGDGRAVMGHRGRDERAAQVKAFTGAGTARPPMNLSYRFAGWCPGGDRGVRPVGGPHLRRDQRHHDGDRSAGEDVARVVGPAADQRPLAGQRRRVERHEQPADLLRRAQREGQLAGAVAGRERRSHRTDGGVPARPGRSGPADGDLHRQVGQRPCDVACAGPGRGLASPRTGQGQNAGDPGPRRRPLGDVTEPSELGGGLFRPLADQRGHQGVLHRRLFGHHDLRPPALDVGLLHKRRGDRVDVPASRPYGTVSRRRAVASPPAPARASPCRSSAEPAEASSGCERVDAEVLGPGAASDRRRSGLHVEVHGCGSISLRGPVVRSGDRERAPRPAPAPVARRQGAGQRHLGAPPARGSGHPTTLAKQDRLRFWRAKARTPASPAGRARSSRGGWEEVQTKWPWFRSPARPPSGESSGVVVLQRTPFVPRGSKAPGSVPPRDDRPRAATGCWRTGLAALARWRRCQARR